MNVTPNGNLNLIPNRKKERLLRLLVFAVDTAVTDESAVRAWKTEPILEPLLTDSTLNHH
jgi:hypothetical protein